MLFCQLVSVIAGFWNFVQVRVRFGLRFVRRRLLNQPGAVGAGSNLVRAVQRIVKMNIIIILFLNLFLHLCHPIIA